MDTRLICVKKEKPYHEKKKWRTLGRNFSIREKSTGKFFFGLTLNHWGPFEMGKHLWSIGGLQKTTVTRGGGGGTHNPFCCEEALDGTSKHRTLTGIRFSHSRRWGSDACRSWTNFHRGVLRIKTLTGGGVAFQRKGKLSNIGGETSKRGSRG